MTLTFLTVLLEDNVMPKAGLTSYHPFPMD